MSETVSLILGLAYFTFMGFVFWRARQMDAEQKRQEERIRQESYRETELFTTVKGIDEAEWQRAYAYSKSRKPYPLWREWMEERGLNPSDIYERLKR